LVVFGGLNSPLGEAYSPASPLVLAPGLILLVAERKSYGTGKRKNVHTIKRALFVNYEKN